jgi:hypothetical protein
VSYINSRGLEVITPELVDSTPEPQEPEWPDVVCPNCGATARQCPENFGATAHIPDWTQDRCYRCGRRSSDSLTQQEKMREAWTLFTQWYQSGAGAGPDLAHPSVSTDNRVEVEAGPDLQAQIDDLKAQLAKATATVVPDSKLEGNE